MPYIRDSFWRRREFTSLAQMQAAAAAWCTEVAGRRSCRSLDGATPGSVFAAVEVQTLQPLPAKPFFLASWSTALVGPDIHARVGKTIYSVPWQLIGQRLEVNALFRLRAAQGVLGPGRQVHHNPAGSGLRQGDRSR